MAASDASSAPARERIEALISASYDTPVRVRAVDRLEPWCVLRCHLIARASDVPGSVVVKWLRDNPDDIRRDPAQLHTEQAALEFVAELDPALVPRLLAADTAVTDPHDRILVLEDLAPGPMWLTVGDPLSNGVEEAYRDTLAQAVPEVTDDHWFGRAVSGAGFIFAAGRLRPLARLDSRPSGDGSRLNRVAAIEAAADAAGRRHCLPQLTAWARAAAENLRRRWPDADIDLKTLEDYTTRQ